MRAGPARAGAVALILVAAAGGCAGQGGKPVPVAGGGSTAGASSTADSVRDGDAGMAAARSFLQGYVEADGRVLRRDQGGDIVSEGEAMAMLIAEAAGQPDTVRSIWSWTRTHLARPDGLLAWHARPDGSIIDAQPAADADTMAAVALLRYRGPDEDSLHADGHRLSAAVMERESATTAGGATVIVAGPWAKGAAPVVNPSYWMTPLFRELATTTGDHRWSQSADTSVNLLAGGSTLPPDWARLEMGKIQPIAAPSGSAGVQYGLDAARLPVWLAADCSDASGRLAAQWWQTLRSSQARTGAIALTLGGRVIDPQANPLPLVAAAAAAQAAGDTGSRGALLAAARVQATRVPTYYGDAWLALGQVLLDKSLVTC